MVTAELAVVFPALAFVLALALGAFGLAVEQIRCVDAARTAARAASRGDSPGAIASVVAASAPRGSAVAFATGGGTVRVTVTAPPGPLSKLLPDAFRPEAAATATIETGEPSS